MRFPKASQPRSQLHGSALRCKESFESSGERETVAAVISSQAVPYHPVRLITIGPEVTRFRSASDEENRQYGSEGLAK